MMSTTVTYMKVISGVFCSVVTFIWGGMDAIFVIFLCLMALDYITGVLSAVKTKSLSSETGFYGLLKKIGMLSIVALAHFIGDYSNMPDIRSLVIGFYIANEGISILENSARLGVPMPQKLVSILKQLNTNS
ncbi:MAG: phage holin family protein [Ruminococcaceae bacterium]|nr:phage holin family protein [Oscillospiraceae bacterium]